MSSPISIGRLRLNNRVVMPAMGVNLAALGGGVTEDIIAFYEERARGGAGLLISEVTRVVDGAGGSDPCQLAARGLADIPDLQRLVDAIHKYPTKFFVQLQHPGAMASAAVTGEKPVLPSYLTEDMKEGFHELSTEECEAPVTAFVTGAVVAQIAGADGVELHGAHGYLINEFLSSAANLRTDKYGGSFEGRMQFIAEIIMGIRAVCGPHFPISVRINAEEDLPGGGTLEDAKQIARALEQLGVDAINVSCMSIGCIEPGTYEQAWKKYMAAAIKEVVSIPVIAVCNIKEPSTGEQLLQEGIKDVIAVGRGHLADSQWCAKALGGRADEIRLCIGCLTCFEEICKLRRVKCAVNPLTGREREYAQPRLDGLGRTVVVVGGGPAGIEAALTLHKRGFKPILFEQDTRLGGTLNIADKGYGKTFITNYVDSLARQLETAGIELRLGEEATVEKVKALDPCGVFMACGALPFVPPVKGIESAQVCSAEDVLLGRVEPSGSVVVAGAGMTGLETAEVLVSRGLELSIVEMLDAVGVGIYSAVVEDVMSRIEPHGAQVLIGHRLEEIMPEAIKLTRLADDETVELKTDWVVLALGVRPRKDLVDEFSAAFDNVQVIGDASIGGRVLEATKDAHGKAFVFSP